MHSLLSGTTKKWLPWVGKLFLTCLSPGFSTSGSCEVWDWPKGGQLQKEKQPFWEIIDRPAQSHSARDLSCCFPSHGPLFRPPPSTLSTPHCLFCSFTAGDRHWCRAWFVTCQSAVAAASCLPEGEMLWCLAAVGVFLQGQRIPSCSPLLQPSPTGWDVWSCLSSHLVDQNKLKEFGVFSLLMPSNVYFFSSQLYCKFWVILDCAYTVCYLKLQDIELNLDCSF